MSLRRQSKPKSRAFPSLALDMYPSSMLPGDSRGNIQAEAQPGFSAVLFPHHLNKRFEDLLEHRIRNAFTLILNGTPCDAVSIVLFSANSEVAKNVADCKAEAFLSKPFTISGLLTTLDAAIR